MRTVLESLLGVVTGVFTLGEADLVTIGINMIMAACVMQVLGTLIIRKIVDIEY